MTPQRFEKAIELRYRFQDKPRISFTELTSMVVMSERGIEEILTEDDHFLHVGMGFRKVP
jgi:predicted nucleic acid-binding protein